MTCMKYHAFLAFLSVYAKLSFLSRKFALCVIYLPIMCLWCSKTPPFAFAWRKGNVATRPTGVATRRFAHFLTSPERSVSRVQRHSTAKKNSRPTRHLLFIPRRKSKSISTGLRHKPQMPRFPSWVFFVRCAFWRARDWHRPAPEESKMKRKALLHHELLRSFSLPHLKRVRRVKKYFLWRKISYLMEMKNGRFKPVFSCLSEH